MTADFSPETMKPDETAPKFSITERISYPTVFYRAKISFRNNGILRWRELVTSSPAIKEELFLQTLKTLEG